MASSRKGQTQKKIPIGSYPQKETVNPQGTGEVRSSLPAQTIGATREASRTNLMEMVVERENMIRALKRVEANKGAPGIDGMKVEDLREFLRGKWPEIREQLLKGNNASNGKRPNLGNLLRGEYRYGLGNERWEESQVPLWLYALAVVGLFAATIVSVRLLGKSAIVQLTPYDLTTVVILGTIAAEPLVNPSFKIALIGMSVLIVSHVFFSRLTLTASGNRLLLGEPTILVKHGKIIKSNLAKSRLSVRQLLASLRFVNQPDLADIEYAILEPIGQLTVIPKPKARALTPEDLGLEIAYKGLPLPVIVDGDIQDGNLKLIEKDREWLLKQLRENGYDRLDEILYAGMADKGAIYVNATGDRSTMIHLGSPDSVSNGDEAESGDQAVFRRRVLVIRDGCLLLEGLLESGLRKKQIQELLRARGLTDIADVQEMIVEVNEQVRIIPRIVRNGAESS